MYLSGIHAGIQTQHCTAELFVKYKNNQEKLDVIYDWAENHKTTIILNGGFSSNLEVILNALNVYKCELPYASFYESKEALNSALTNVSIIIPERLYYLTENIDDLLQYERLIVDLLQKSHLMR